MIDVLLVEDSPESGAVLSEMLQKWGHRVRWETTQAGALAAIDACRFPLILLDILLPDGDATRIIPRIRQLRPDACLVAMTGYNTREMEARVRGLGVGYYLIKPMEFKHLEAIVSHVDAREAVNETPGAVAVA